ncbi:MAG TPA: prolyl oligopeptidase family serine peptidase [Candidatus Polarisedimenticolaceae bacterium]|nr:prolyl oligopeptidase family serine peptidase [Candidatus Polarisedimenticolaceae bacterium]
MRALRLAVAVALLAAPFVARAADDDPYQWLEEVEGTRSLSWVKEQNTRSLGELQAVKEYQPIYDKTLSIYDSQDKIAFPNVMGRYIYNFWQDKAHARGIWRRTSISSYKTASPQWDTVIDLDALSRDDKATWVWKGADCAHPDFRRCLINLSRGGGDAVVVREFDTETKSFVKDGFTLPEAKTEASFKDLDTLWVSTDFGPDTLTTSGYARIVKLWKRGTPLASAKTVLTAKKEDVGVGAGTEFTADGKYDLVGVNPTIFTRRSYLMVGDRLVHLSLPEDADFRGIFRDRAIFEVRSDWKPGATTYKQGSLLAVAIDDLLADRDTVSTIFEPSERVSLGEVRLTKDQIVMSTLDNVRSKLYRVNLGDAGWTKEEIALPGQGNADIVGTSRDNEIFFYQYQDFLTPSSLFLVEKEATTKIKSLPAYFDAAGMSVNQYEATSKDGTKIPYFVVAPKGFKADGTASTLLYAYGGFEVAEQPSYSGVVGSAWLARGGVYVLANIRGGGEFGPAWHLAAIKANRLKTNEDFVAVAQDLIAKKITTSRHLGIMGGSNGGLLVGTAFTLQPDLFHAVVCQVPLLDMKRYSHLLAGASWMDEYGDPDKPEDWSYIQTFSPYQLVKKDVQYPRVFFWTTTKDDRVHPAHARKMVAKMLGQGHDVLYFENVEGGHGTGGVNSQKALTVALQYAYLWKTLE